MKFRDTSLPDEIENVQIPEAEREGLNPGLFDFELDFAEQYRDADGILHIKTSFQHDSPDESELWEVFAQNDSSHPLELLLQERE